MKKLLIRAMAVAASLLVLTTFSAFAAGKAEGLSQVAAGNVLAMHFQFESVFNLGGISIKFLQCTFSPSALRLVDELKSSHSLPKGSQLSSVRSNSFGL